MFTDVVGQCFQFQRIEIVRQIESFEIDDSFRKALRFNANFGFPPLRRFPDEIKSVTDFSYN